MKRKKAFKGLIKRTSTGAAEGIRHATAITEPGGENLRLVDAELAPDGVEDGIDKSNVTAARVSPAVIDTVGCNENGVVAGESPQTVVVGVDIVHGAAQPVKAEDEHVTLGAVVVVGQLEDVLPVHAIDVDGLETAAGRVPAAASGVLAEHALDAGQQKCQTRRELHL